MKIHFQYYLKIRKKYSRWEEKDATELKREVFENLDLGSEFRHAMKSDTENESKVSKNGYK